MRGFKRATWLTVALCAALAPLAPATATSFTATSAIIDPTVSGVNMTVHFAGLGASGQKDAKVGRNLLQGTDIFGSPVSFETYCADIFSALKAGAYSETGTSALHFDSTRIAAATTFLAHADPLVSDRDSSAAAQLGLWEILYETTGAPYDVTSGDFFATSNRAVAGNLANSWLGSLASNDWHTVPGLSLTVFNPGVGAQAQVMIVSTPGGEPLTAVPEPTSWAMMAGGFGLLGGLMRTQRRRREDGAPA